MIESYEDVVRGHYRDSLQVESTDLVAFCGWRLTAYGRTIAVGESEQEMWEEGYEHVAGLLGLEDDDTDEDTDDEDEAEDDGPGIETKKAIVCAYYAHQLTIEVPRDEARFFRASVYGRTVGLSRSEFRMWTEAYQSACESAGSRLVLHALTGDLYTPAAVQ